MTTNKFKTILFASLIAAMILPFSGMQSAEAALSDDPKRVAVVLAKITPYITINDDKTISFDKKDAREDGLDRKTIRQGNKIVKEQNALVKGEIIESKILGSYFKSKTFTEMGTTQSCNWNGAGDPTQNFYSTGETTLAGAQDHLSGMNYHKIAWYALHPGAWGNQELADRDHQKSVWAHGCESGVFRTEALILPDYTQYLESTPEPNPEYLDNSWSWPVWYWPVYVADWHDNH